MAVHAEPLQTVADHGNEKSYHHQEPFPHLLPLVWCRKAANIHTQEQRPGVDVEPVTGVSKILLPLLSCTRDEPPSDNAAALAR